MGWMRVEDIARGRYEIASNKAGRWQLRSAQLEECVEGMFEERFGDYAILVSIAVLMGPVGSYERFEGHYGTDERRRARYLAELGGFGHISGERIKELVWGACEVLSDAVKAHGRGGDAVREQLGADPKNCYGPESLISIGLKCDER